MRIIGTWKPVEQPKDNRKYVARCVDPNCRCIVEFRGYEIKYVHEEGKEYKGEFCMICKTRSRDFYAVSCGGCGAYIWLGDDERMVISHLKSERERFKAIKKYDSIHDVDYD